MTNPKLIYRLLILSIISHACLAPPATTRVPREQNLADIYNPSRSTIRPDFSIYHVNDSLSVIYIRVFTSELLFSQANVEGIAQANLRIRYELRRLQEGFREGILVDSGDIERTLNRNEARNSYFAGLPVKADTGNQYYLLVNVYDETRGTRHQASLILDKTSGYTAQNYKVLSGRYDVPLFTPSLAGGQYFRIEFNQPDYDSIYVDYYEPDYSLPRPVFSSVPEAPPRTFPDSAWSIPFIDTIMHELPKPGTYVFRVDNSRKEGLVLLNFGDNYPRVVNANDMLAPLVYLTSSTEFRDLRMQANRKLAIDNFWLGIAGNPDAARELIKVYYNRVQFANIHFTSNKEGWKTDRGMIYIIFGSPNMLEMNIDGEKWTYFTSRGNSPIEFIFERKSNMFTNKDYRSERDPGASPHWRNAVQTWRKGKIYSSIN